MKIQVADLDFEPLISYETIRERVEALAGNINADFSGKTPILIGVLNGSFLFMADLVKQLTIPCQVSFIKLASYHGATTSSREVREDFGLSVDIADRAIILIEDIVDTGNTLHYLIAQLKQQNPSSIAVCSLLLKPKALAYTIDELKYIGFEIENDFVVGYGLDYKELGRNLKGIYKK